jgi:hypothetical protein
MLTYSSLSHETTLQVSHSYTLNDKEISKKDHRKSKWQHIYDSSCNLEKDKTDDCDVDHHDDQDPWVEQDLWGDTDFEFRLDFKDMGERNEDDSDDSQSTEEACIEDNFFQSISDTKCTGRGVDDMG